MVTSLVMVKAYYKERKMSFCTISINPVIIK